MDVEQNFVTVNGMALGEETKGNTVQSLVRELDAHTVWRSGGWQSGHHILHEDGREMAFSFYGAAAFDGADTYLRHMAISSVELFQEAVELEGKGVPNALSMIAVDQNCLSSTPYHSAISRTREILRGKNKKGTVGKGVGEALRDSMDPDLAIRAGDFHDRNKVRRNAENIRRLKLATVRRLIANHSGPVPEDVYPELAILEDEALSDDIAAANEYLSDLVAITDDAYLATLLGREGAIVNEVSHGVLHHPRYGFVPHITQIDPTSMNVIRTVRDHEYQGTITRLGVVRSYFTRHGAGPLVSYSPELTRDLTETHNNVANDWLGEFRNGHFDVVALDYAFRIEKDTKAVDGLMVSFLDVLATRDAWDVCEAYEYTGQATDLEDYFYLEGDKIVGIKLHQDEGGDEHYRHQLRLTELLKECRPILTTLSSQDGEKLEDLFISYVESRMDVPVVGRAYGPGVYDRHFTPRFAEVLRP